MSKATDAPLASSSSAPPLSGVGASAAPEPAPEASQASDGGASKWDPEKVTRFVCISDTHNKHGKLTMPPGDVLIHAGDFSNVGLPEDVVAFSEWLATLPYKHKIVIAGNHDLTFEESSYEHNWRRFRHPKKFDTAQTKAILAANCTYLEDQSVNVLGFNIYGSPYQPEFFDWAFNLPRGKECDNEWKKIPQNTDILVTHGPPEAFGGLCVSGIDAGCSDLLRHIQRRVKPLVHVSGHIHEGYGITTDGATVYINASNLDVGYKAVHDPIVFDLPNSLRRAAATSAQPAAVFLPASAASMNTAQT